MNEARKAVEQYKEKLKCNPVKRMFLESERKLPENINNLPIIERWHEEWKAFDEVIAKEAGVTLTDSEEWNQIGGKEQAERWASTLPDL